MLGDYDIPAKTLPESHALFWGRQRVSYVLMGSGGSSGLDYDWYCNPQNDNSRIKIGKLQDTPHFRATTPVIP